MTKARDLANIISGGFTDADIPNLPASKITSGTLDNARITLDAAEIPNISTDKLTSGTLANARVADLPTSKITSGTFADARISASSVTAHVTQTDLTPVRQDVLTLALKQAIQENSTKFNLTNSSICKFEADADFNLAGSTTTARDASEFIKAGSEAGLVPTKAGIVVIGGLVNVTFSFQGSNNDSSWTTLVTGIIGGSGGAGEHAETFSNTTAYRYLRYLCTQKSSTGYYFGEMKIYTGSYDLHVWTGAETVTINTIGEWSGWEDSGAPAKSHNNNDTTNFSNMNNLVADTSWWKSDLLVSSASATGTALGTTNVPTSAVTDVSGVMLLKNAYGTNTLGTDVKVYFTADNSNFTECTYTDAGTFSTGIKMIKLGKTTCTSGSDVRWKVVWANQAAASKEGHIYGIGLNY